MTNIKCIIVDDEPLAISLIEKYVSRVPQLQPVFSTANPVSALAYIQHNEVDLVFLDIQMPELSGISFMKIAGEHFKYILTTAYAEYALEGYEHNVIDYLLKPISFERFEKAAQKAQQRFTAPQQPDVFVKSSGQQYRIELQKILYIESLKDYVNIRTDDEEYIVLDTLKSWEQQLDGSGFIRVHKSYIVNLDKIKSFGAKTLVLVCGYEVPIGEHYRQRFLERLQ